MLVCKIPLLARAFGLSARDDRVSCIQIVDNIPYRRAWRLGRVRCASKGILHTRLYIVLLDILYCCAVCTPVIDEYPFLKNAVKNRPVLVRTKQYKHFFGFSNLNEYEIATSLYFSLFLNWRVCCSSLIDLYKTRACLIALHSNFEIFQKGHPAVEVKLDRRIFER